jgi:uncharacterized damage-inducible protein DinB
MKRTRTSAPGGEIAHILDEIRRSHRGDPWHGPGVARVLRGVTAEAAAARPIAGAHSIWELVNHLAAWRGEVARRAASGEFGQPPEGDWPPAGSGEAAWRAARARLAAAERKLARALAAFPPGRLGRVVGGERDAPLGTGVTFRVMLHGVAQHDAYHAGQMSLLKRALGLRP